MMHVMIRIMIVTVFLLMLIPNTEMIILDSRGVATLKVVAVPAIRANSANISIIFPGILSAYFPIRGLHASEKRMRFLFFTWIMNPKKTDRTR